ncbi:MAG TPA: ABC transporter ATP-binding protein [Candidatus Merdenecus merdavium]|nr:ABC transporter ATP-binding protein [Candidatus Merdenecus merdavium]
MIKLFRFVRDKWYFIIMIIALLFLQASADLALPDYTSKIINVGIQQKGVEDAVPNEIRESSMDDLFLFMEDEDIQGIKEHYSLEDDVYHLNKINNQEREQLNEIFGIPMLLTTGLTADSDMLTSLKEEMQVPEETNLLDVFAEMPKDQWNQVLEEMSKEINIEEMSDSIITQSAVKYIQDEYIQMGKDIDKLQSDYILTSGVRMLGVALVSMAAAVSVTFLSCKVAASMGRHLRNNVYRKVISFSGNELNQFSTASLITRSTNDIQQVQLFVTMLFRIVLYAPILGIGGVLKVLNTNSSMTWILAVAVGSIILLVMVLFVVAMPKFKSLQNLIDKLNLVTRETLTGITVIRAFSNQKHEEQRFEDANKTLTKTNLFVNRSMTFMMPIMMLIMNLITVLITYNGALAVDAGNMQVGNIMAFIQYTMQIIMSFLMLTVLSIILPRASVSAKRINEVMETEVSIKSPQDIQRPSSDIKGSIEFDHVSFGYPGAEENVLDDISFKAKKGETVAFIGSTGSGKSTLVNLIPRIFDVTKGAIKINGVDIRQMSLKELRDRIGYVPQKGVLFSGDIESNIKYGKEDATEAEVEKAAKIAQAWDFVSEKPEGIHSAIAQGGSNVSGGQKQRLSIARAVAKDPEFYIFDDSFSALDYKTDVVLRRALKQETGDATTLIVAQRISTILHADNIIVLEDGRVAGQGTHKELLKTCDVYKQIAMSQLSEEELSDE